MQHNGPNFRGFFLERASIYIGPQDSDSNNQGVYSTGTYAPRNANNQVTITETTSTTVGVNGSVTGGGSGTGGSGSGTIGGSFSATESSSVSFTIQDFSVLVGAGGATSRALYWSFFLKKVGVGEEYFNWMSLIDGPFQLPGNPRPPFASQFGSTTQLPNLPILANGLGLFSPQTDGYWETVDDKTGVSNFVAMTAAHYRSVALDPNI